MIKHSVAANGFAGVNEAEHGQVIETGSVWPGPSRESQAGSYADRLCLSLHQRWLPLIERFLALPKNMFYSHLLQAEDIQLGSGNRIKGVKMLQIGRGFKALDQLWLAAIERDKAGNRYKPSLIIGNDVVFGHSVHVAATNCVRIGNGVLVGSRVIITDHNHGIYSGEFQSSPLEPPADRVLTSDAEAVVEDDVWIGDGVAILPGSWIGKGSVIGANSVVNSAIPAYCIAAGCPARPIRVYDPKSKSWVQVN